MGLTLSHLSALDVIRTLRAEGVNLNDLEPTVLRRPSTWIGKRWSTQEFASPEWKWGVPTRSNQLHVMVPDRRGRLRMAHVVNHQTWRGLPPKSVLWIDGNTSIASPELLFVQMAESLSFPALVLLGYELCGYFSRFAADPLNGEVRIHVPAATSVERIQEYVDSCSYTRMASRAAKALSYVTDSALSAPEAVLATVFTLPVEEAGYGMGPVTLNSRVHVTRTEGQWRAKHRFPDIMFSFAPVGFNYDGEDHLDLSGLEGAARRVELVNDKDRAAAITKLETKKRAVRAKAVDDIRRNRELLAAGRIVLPVTKEDLNEDGGLDNLTRQLLSCAQAYFGLDTQKYERMLNDTDQACDRNNLLHSMLPGGMPKGVSHGLM